MLSRFFIQRPIFATVISMVILLAGAVSQTRLPVAKFPEISPPTVKVAANYPGANAQVVAETVAAPIEQEVNGVQNMLSMSSNSAADGSYALTVTFEIGTDMDMATVLVQNRVAIAEPKLPEEVRRQGITVKKQSTQIVQMITLEASDNRFDALYLSNYANLNLRDQLGRIPGVGEVTVFGAGDYSMRIWLEPDKLKARQMTADDLIAALREQNVQVAAGQIGSPPAPPGTAFQYTVEALGRLREIEQFENIIVKRAEGGRLTYLRDVARVELGAKSYAYDAKFNGTVCAAIAIYQLPGANALEVADRVRSAMNQLSTAFPPGIDYQIPFDTTRFVRASIRQVYVTLLQAVVLVVLVIYLFLQDWRATVIPCAAIPVSLVGTFAVMAAIGFSVNMLTLFGIVLAIGIVVDDAIVVVENTARHLDRGLSPKAAATKAMQEITGPVIATTLVLLAVFVPTAFLGGITGQLFRQFALTISGAVVISTINALTLSPALCALLLRPTPPDGVRRFLLFRWFNAAFDRTTGGYNRTVRSSVRRLALVLTAYALLLALTGWGFSRLPTGFVPAEDQGYVFANVQLPDAASLERTQATMSRVDQILLNTPGISDVISIAGYSLLSGTNSSNMGMVFVIFEPWETRRDPAVTQEAILAGVRRQFREIREAIVFAFVPPAIDGLGVAGGFQMQVQDRRDLGLTALESAAQEMVAVGSGQPGLRNLNTTFSARVPQLFVEVDRTKAANLDVPLSSVFGALQAYLGSAYVNDFNRFGRTYQVRVQADQKYRMQPEDIQRLDVRNARGAMVPLGTLVNVRPSSGAQVITRYNLYPSAQINGEAAPGFSSGDSLSLMEQMAAAQLPDGMGFEWTGMSYQEKLASGGQYGVFLLAIVFVFLVLAAQYESWSSPAAVIAVVPLAALGVVLALLMTGMDNNSYTQIGVVLLVALASKNAILIVEFARELRREGKSIRDAAAEAAQTRFRAILMTAFSSILGFLPLVLASGAGAASRQAVGNAIVGGMIAATLFSLVLVPAFFVVFQGLAERFAKRRSLNGVTGSVLMLGMMWMHAGKATAEDWPEFRGPGGQGHSHARSLPVDWDLETDLLWKVALPGHGWSSPIVHSGRVFVTTAISVQHDSRKHQSLRALSLDAATGEILWNVEVFAKTLGPDESIHPKNSYASSTPITDGQRLYVHFGPDGTACLDDDGRLIWTNDRLQYDSVYGAGGSPIFSGSRLIVLGDGAEDPFVAALERDSGVLAWRTPRPAMPSPRWSFATPLQIEVAGRRQIVCPAANMVCSYDPETGDELWRVRYPNRWSIVPRPVFSHGLVFVCTGYTGPPELLAIRPTGAGDVTDSHVAWRTDSGVPHTPSLLIVGDQLFMISDQGIASCRDVETGALHWRQRVGGNFSASPLHAAGRIYLVSEQGVCTVIAAETEYQPLAKNDLGERTFASFAVIDQSILVRTQQHLYRIH